MTGLRGLRVFLCLGLCLLSFCPGTRIAAATRQTSRPIVAVSVDYPQIRLRVKILASSSADIGRDDFELWENDQLVPLNVVASRTPRQSMILLLDRSSSIAPSVRDIKLSAARFLMALPRKAKIGVISFASDVEINQRFTTNRKDLLKAIRGIRPWGGTALYDALYLSCEQLYSDSDPSDLRTLVVFTDGKDETPALRKRMSIKTLKEVLAIATRNNIRIIAVGMGTEIDRQKLKQLARATNGWYQYAPSAKELFGIYSRIAQRLKQEQHFRLGYLTPVQRNSGTKVKVKLLCRSTEPPQQLSTEYEVPIRRIQPRLRPIRTVKRPRPKPKPPKKVFIPTIRDSSIKGKFAPQKQTPPPAKGVDLPDLPEGL